MRTNHFIFCFLLFVIVDCKNIFNNFFSKQEELKESNQIFQECIYAKKGSEKELKEFLECTLNDSQVYKEDSFLMYLQICEEFKDNPKSNQLCIKFLNDAKDKFSRSEESIEGISIPYLLEGMQVSKPGECTEVEKSIYKKQVSSRSQEFKNGLLQYCENKLEVSNESFSKGIEINKNSGNSSLVNLSKEYIIKSYYSPEEGFIYRKTLEYREKYRSDLWENFLNRYKEFDNTPAFIIAKLERNLPLYASYPKQKLGKKEIDQYLKDLEEKTKPCATANPACKIFASELYRLRGQYNYINGKHKEAIDEFKKGLEKWNENFEIYPYLLSAATIARDEETIEKYKTDFSKYAKEEYKFLNDSGNVKGLLDQGEDILTDMEAKKIESEIRVILNKILKTEFVKNRIPITNKVRILITSGKGSDNVSTTFKNNTITIFFGKNFLSDIVKEYPKDKNIQEGIIAGVLGHELHHVIGGHLRKFCSFSENPEFVYNRTMYSNPFGKKAKDDWLNLEDSWKDEYEADEEGLRYAFLAGYRGEDFLRLFEYWIRKYPFQVFPELSGGDPHPPNRLRLKRLIPKVRQLHTAASANFEAIDRIKKVSRLIKNFSPDKKNAKKILEEAEKLLDISETEIGVNPSIVVNRSYILLQSILIDEKTPEIPMHISYEEIPGINLQYSLEEEAKSFFGKDCREEYPNISCLRTSLKRNPFSNEKEVNYKLDKVIELLEPALKEFRSNDKIRNNLSVAYYYKAYIEVRKFLSTKKEHRKENKNEHIPMKARKYIEKALNALPTTKNSLDIQNNRAAIEIAKIHFINSYSKDNCPEKGRSCEFSENDLKLLLKNLSKGKEEKIVNIYIKNNQECKNEEVLNSLPSFPKKNNISYFTLGYLFTLQYSYKKEQGTVSVDKENKMKCILNAIHTKYKIELEQMKNSLERNTLRKEN